jgi:hypothetical protein
MLRRYRALVVVLAVVAGAGISRAAPAKPLVLFDEAHGQRFLSGQTGPLDLSGLTGLFKAAGWDVRTTRTRFDTDTLAGVDVLVISGPFAPLTPPETETVLQFVQRGGRLCVMLHIAPPVDQLLHRLNVAISNGVIRERQNLVADDPLNFAVTRLEPHPLLRNVEAFNVYGGWALRNLADNATVIASTSSTAWIDLNGNNALDERDPVQSFGVVVAGRSGQGRFAILGDDAIFQNQFLIAGNLALARNLVAWLGSEATPPARPKGGI